MKFCTSVTSEKQLTRQCSWLLHSYNHKTLFQKNPQLNCSIHRSWRWVFIFFYFNILTAHVLIFFSYCFLLNLSSYYCIFLRWWWCQLNSTNSRFILVPDVLALLISPAVAAMMFVKVLFSVLPNHSNQFCDETVISFYRLFLPFFFICKNLTNLHFFIFFRSIFWVW